jgi:hypothetical protein
MCAERDTGGPLAALKRCEEELRRFAAEAAASGDYDRLERIAATARKVSDLASEWLASDAPGSGTDEADAATPFSSPEAAPSRMRGTRPTAGRGYPRFMRRGDELVKIGWSKAGRKEYQHRAPHSLLVALQKALLDASRARKLFTMDTLERYLAANDVPGYQAYAWLAWLRSAGLVKQHGRQGYTLVKAATFETDIEKALVELPAQGL